MSQLVQNTHKFKLTEEANQTPISKRLEDEKCIFDQYSIFFINDICNANKPDEHATAEENSAVQHKTDQ